MEAWFDKLQVGDVPDRPREVVEAALAPVVRNKVEAAHGAPRSTWARWLRGRRLMASCRGWPPQVGKLRRPVRTIGLDRISESKFISVVGTAVILDSEHLNGGVETLRVAQDGDLSE